MCHWPSRASLAGRMARLLSLARLLGVPRDGPVWPVLEGCCAGRGCGWQWRCGDVPSVAFALAWGLLRSLSSALTSRGPIFS